MTDPVEIANMVVAKAEIAMRPLDMEIKNWRPEFRSIMWGAVAEIASRRAAEADAALKTSE